MFKIYLFALASALALYPVKKRLHSGSCAQLFSELATVTQLKDVVSRSADRLLWRSLEVRGRKWYVSFGAKRSTTAKKPAKPNGKSVASSLRIGCR